MVRKPGRHAKHYRTTWGELIEGLSLRSTGRFYPVGRNDVCFGQDERLALHRFRKWQAEQGIDVEPFDPYEADSGSGAQADYWRNYYRNLILDNPRQAALELDVPHLAFYPEEPDKPAQTLAELGDYYHAEKRNKKGKPLDAKHRKLGETWWTEFCDCVGVRYARDLTRELVEKYRKQVMAAFDGGMSPTYVKHRFGKVKTVFAFGVEQGKDATENERVLTLCKTLIVPADNPTNPAPVSREDFAALVEQADKRQKAILLAALNFCMKSGEVAELDKADMNLDKRTLVTQRGKTGVTRVAVIWERTAEAIAAMKPHNAAHLFNSRVGSRLTAKAAGRIVQHLRQKANLPDSVTFDTIRDGAYSAAIEAGADLTQAKLLAGHKVGMPDHYIRRNPRMVEDCCAAIEAHYFGSA